MSKLLLIPFTICVSLGLTGCVEQTSQKMIQVQSQVIKMDKRINNGKVSVNVTIEDDGKQREVQLPEDVVQNSLCKDHKYKKLHKNERVTLDYEKIVHTKGTQVLGKENEVEQNIEYLYPTSCEFLNKLK